MVVLMGATAPVPQQATPTQMTTAAQVRVPVGHGLRHTNEQPGVFGCMCGAVLLALIERIGSGASAGEVVLLVCQHTRTTLILKHDPCRPVCVLLACRSE